MNEIKRAEFLPVANLHPFAGHPFQVRDNEEMDALVESILSGGILTPLTVRPMEGKDGDYEIISGHRRLYAARKAGMKSVPAFVVPMSRDEATIVLVDSNLHREHILPSEKAFAYKLKMEALAHQGQTCGQVGHKSRDMLSEKESGRQVQRYIRLVDLIPGILQKVDEGKMALTPAVELSYLTWQEQTDLLETMESEDCTPSLFQAIQMKRLSQAGDLSIERIFSILTQPKANQREKISFRVEDMRRFFPRSATAAQMQAQILKLLEENLRRQQRQMER